MTHPRSYTISQVAEYLAVSERTVRREIDDGRLAVVRVRRTVRVTDAALRDYLRIVCGGLDGGRDPP